MEIDGKMGVKLLWLSLNLLAFQMVKYSANPSMRERFALYRFLPGLLVRWAPKKLGASLDSAAWQQNIRVVHRHTQKTR